MLGFVTKHIAALRRQELVLVIESIHQRVQLTLLRRSPGSNVFELLTSESAIAPSHQSVVLTLRQLLKDVPTLSRLKIILSLDHEAATMFEAQIVVTRPDSTLALSGSEFENLLSQALWKLFNGERPRAAVKMVLPVVSITIADADVLSIKLDDHRVMSALGFKAKSIRFDCRQTLVNQVRFSQLLEELPEEQLLSVQESSASAACLIAASEPGEAFLFVALGEAQTVLYRKTDNSFTYLDVLTWGGRDILKSVAGVFAVAPEEAGAFIDRYMTGRASRAVLKRVEEALKNELAILRNVIQTHRLKSGLEKIYVQPLSEIPKAVFEPHFLKRAIGSSVVAVTEELISQKTGFTLTLSTPELAQADWTSVLSSVALAYGARDYEAESKIAKRRARWLSSDIKRT